MDAMAVRRYHKHFNSSGHVWQGRFKSFPIQGDSHLLTVMRYVERNPVHAKTIPVRKAQNWPWSSVGTPLKDTTIPTPDAGPVKRKRNSLEWVSRWRMQNAMLCKFASIGASRWAKTNGKRKPQNNGASNLPCDHAVGQGSKSRTR